MKDPTTVSEDFLTTAELFASTLQRVDSLTASIDVEDADLRDLGSYLGALQTLQRTLSDLVDEIANEIAARMEDDAVTIPGLGYMTRRAKTSSVWIHDGAREQMFEDARRAITQRVAKDPATGEVYQPIAMAVAETLRLVEDVFSIGADPKAGFRKVLNLDPSMYRSKRTSGYAVKVETEGDDR